MSVKAEDVEKKLREELDYTPPEAGAQRPETTYSDDYKSFKKDQVDKTVTRYEKACALAEHLIGARLKPEKKAEISNYLTLTHINANPEATVALAYLVAFLSVVFMFMTPLPPLVISL